MRRILYYCGIIGLVLLFSRLGFGQVSYSITDLGDVNAAAINDAGQVAGTYAVNGVDSAFLYTDGSFEDLGTFGEASSSAAGLNNLGDIVGAVSVNSDPTSVLGDTAFLYSGGPPKLLGTLGGSWSGATAVNDSGEVVGESQAANGSTEAFLYNGTSMQPLGGTVSVAYGINDAGQIVGEAAFGSSNYTHAFLYNADSMQDLGTLGGRGSEAFAINNTGQIAGDSIDASGTRDAFLYSNGKMQNLGTLGGSIAASFGINSSGQIVGLSQTASGSTHAFISNSSGSLTDLNTLIPANSGWTLTTANAINNLGQIVGSGTNSAGQTQAVLLTPYIQTQQTTQTPSVAPPATATGELLIFSRATGTLVPASPGSIQNGNTYIITHGWQWIGGSTDLQSWVPAMAANIASGDLNANVLVWDWAATASSFCAGQQVGAEGQLLAQQLDQTLTSTSAMQNDLHFIGHSLGTLVDKQAIDSLDEPTSSGGYGLNLGARTEVTILDAPEVQGTQLVPAVPASMLSPVPQPGNYSGIDNFISAFGNLQAGAENIILQHLPLEGLADFHDYAYDFYDGTTNLGSSNVGFGTTPVTGTYYQQQNRPSLVVTAITESQAEAAVPTAVQRTAWLGITGITGTLSVAGNVVANIVEGGSGPIYQSTPQFIFNGHASSDAWIPLTIPSDAQGLTFNTLFHDVPPGDSLAVGIGDQLIWSLDGAYASQDTAENSGTIDVSQWDGQNVQLFIGLFPGGLLDQTSNAITALDSADESVTVDGIQFTFVPEPGSVFLLALGAAASFLRRRRRIS